MENDLESPEIEPSDDVPPDPELTSSGDELPWKSLDVPQWVIIAIGLTIIAIGVAATWKALA